VFHFGLRERYETLDIDSIAAAFKGKLLTIWITISGVAHGQESADFCAHFLRAGFLTSAARPRRIGVQNARRVSA
jgi:hypothetical protein